MELALLVAHAHHVVRPRGGHKAARTPFTPRSAVLAVQRVDRGLATRSAAFLAQTFQVSTTRRSAVSWSTLAWIVGGCTVSTRIVRMPRSRAKSAFFSNSAR